MSQLVTLKAVCKSFSDGNKQLHVLKNINLQTDSGESLAITGASGSGKSTLLSIIGLLDEPDSGEIYLKKHLVSEFTDYQKRTLRNREIGWIFQNFNLVGHLDVLENVTLPLRYNPQVNWREYSKKGKKVLHSVGLEDKAGAFPGELSGGQQQRVAIARALINKPGLILADEPTGNLDFAMSQEIASLLLQTVSQGTALILVTHERTLAAQCDRQVLIQNGVIVDAEPTNPV